MTTWPVHARIDGPIVMIGFGSIGKGTLPLMVNLSGMIPLIFAGAILQFPTILASYFTRSTNYFRKT